MARVRGGPVTGGLTSINAGEASDHLAGGGLTGDTLMLEISAMLALEAQVIAAGTIEITQDADGGATVIVNDRRLDFTADEHGNDTPTDGRATTRSTAASAGTTSKAAGTTNSLSTPGTAGGVRTI